MLPLLASLLACALQAPPRFTATILEQPPGSTGTVAFAVNSAGVVVGFADTPSGSVATAWDPSGRVTLLHGTQIRDVNEAGVAVGWTGGSAMSAMAWPLASPTPHPLGQWGFALGIDAHANILAQTNDYGPRLLSRDGTVYTFGNWTDTATALSSSGTAVGYSLGLDRAWRWTPPAAPEYLAPPAPWAGSFAFGIAPTGVVLGSVAFITRSRACTWTPAGQPVLLAKFSAASTVARVNAAGPSWLVGREDLDAVLWTDAQHAYALTDLLDGAPADLSLRDALDATPNGYVAAIGYLAGTGTGVAVRLDPVP